MLLLPVVAILLVAVFVWSIFNKLQTMRVRIKASIQEIGNQLKRQADLIPNLQNVVKAHLSHERGVYETLAKARSKITSALQSGDLKEMADAGDFMQKSVMPIMATFEDNPEFKAAELGQNLMENLRDSSDKVMYSRRLLIDLTADFNTVLAVFPSNLVGKVMGFVPEKGLEMPESGSYRQVTVEETQTPRVEL